MGERLRAMQWTEHPLGAPDTWPLNFKAALRLLLASPAPMWLGWGRPLYFFYNDAYASTLGSKDRWALGTPLGEVWPEASAAMAPAVERVLRTGEGAAAAGVSLLLERHGYPEETYHRFSYTPVHDDAGAVGGLLCIAVEETERVIGERRSALRRDLAAALIGPGDEAALFAAVRAQFAAHARDLPFALIYLFATDDTQARLACRHGVAHHHRLAPEFFALTTDSPVWPAREILAGASTLIVDDLGTHGGDVPRGPWDTPPREAAIVPLASRGGALTGFLVAGLNPYRPRNAESQAFLEELANVIATGLVTVRAHEAGRSRATLPTAPDRSTTARNVGTFIRDDTAVADLNDTSAANASLANENQFDLPLDSGGRVLVVDDHTDMRRYIARVLSARFDVASAPTRSAALESIRTWKPHLVLIDDLGGEVDGPALLRAIRAQDTLRTLPVILLSSSTGEAACVAGLEAGADDFIAQPFAARELLARVSVHVQMSRRREQAEAQERELRRQAEVLATTFRENIDRLSASLAAAGTGTFRWDLATNLLDFDESRCRLFGLSPIRKTLPLAEFIRLVHADDRARVAAACDRVLAHGEALNLEYRVALPDSSPRWVEDKGRTFFDATGKAVHMTGACMDVTKRKQTEMFVWRQKDVLEQIVQGAPLADVLETLTLDVEQVAERKLVAMVTMVDPEGKHLRMAAGRRCPVGWNRVVDRMPIGLSGGSCGAAALRHERVIVPDVMTSPFWERYRTEAVKRGLRACCSTPIISSRGTVLGTFAIYCAEPSAPTENEIHFVDIVARTAAIAVEREKSELALKASQAELAEHAQQLERRVQERTARLQETVSELESFSYSISHDMRAPLRAMQSFAQILAEECSEQIGTAGKDYIRRIIGASDRMDRLIQDVLTYSRVTRTELPLEPIDVEKLIDGILESYPQFQPPHAEIEIKRPLPRVKGNEAALVQCLSNLIGNAIKFVAPGVVPRVQIWAETHGERVRLYVRDNGIGVEPESHEKIFRIFYQLDRSYSGTGIGLSIVRKAAERMGGSVGLKSQLNRGSTFHLELLSAS